MSLWLERLNELNHYHTLLQEAEQYRLARLTYDPWLTMHQVFCNAMDWLKNRLSPWENHFQSRPGNDAGYPISPGGHPGEKKKLPSIVAHSISKGPKYKAAR